MMVLTKKRISLKKVCNLHQSARNKLMINQTLIKHLYYRFAKVTWKAQRSDKQVVLISLTDRLIWQLQTETLIWTWTISEKRSQMALIKKDKTKRMISLMILYQVNRINGIIYHPKKVFRKRNGDFSVVVLNKQIQNNKKTTRSLKSNQQKLILDQ